jgi:glycosyltransferase involved in cell wall biosynthesis
VIDDGSTDPVQVSDLPPDDRIRVIHRAHAGQVDTRNAGLIQARGDWIAFLDADDVWHPQKLEIQMAVIDAHPDAAAVASRCRTWTGPIDAVLKDWSAQKPLMDLNAAVPSARPYSLKELVRSNPVVNSSVILSRNILETVGLPDEAARDLEDWDFWLRIVARHAFWWVDRELLLWVRHEGALSNRLTTARKMELTRQLFDRHEDLLRRELGEREWRAARAHWDVFFAIRFMIFEQDGRAARRLLLRARRDHPEPGTMLKPFLASWLPARLRSRLSPSYRMPADRPMDRR